MEDEIAVTIQDWFNAFGTIIITVVTLYYLYIYKIYEIFFNIEISVIDNMTTTKSSVVYKTRQINNDLGDFTPNKSEFINIPNVFSNQIYNTAMKGKK